jgi:hypothetical protein
MADLFAGDAGDHHHLLLLDETAMVGGAELEAAMGHDHQHGPVLNLRLLLQKAIGLRRQA